MRRRAFLTLPGVAFAASPPKWTLARNGRSPYSIVIAPDASPSEHHAAGELQRFLEQMTGARLPIATAPSSRMVLVGDSPALQTLRLDIPFGNLGPEGFVLRTAPPHVVIAGGRLRGTMYGVYTFLEKLGCRWFTRDISRIPRLPTLTIGPLDETHKPAFEYREPFFSEAADRDWAARNKMNGVLQNLDAATGGKVQYYPFVHSFNLLVPPEKYFREHPEYFSLIDGKRRAERSQLCLTNPDVLRVGVESVRRWIAEHPEATIFSVSQNDWTGWCECDNCRRVEQEEGGAHSGPLLRFVNALAAEIDQSHPGKLIDTLAYWYTEDPPAKARPRANVRIRLCPIGVCEAHPYAECPHSAYFMRNLEAWSKITKQLYIWHYNTNFAHYLLPFPDFDELAADLPMYQAHGVVGLFMEGSVTKGGGAENAELRSYIMAKLLWDPRADVKAHIREFHENYYGKAAPAMLRYFQLMQRQVNPAGGGRHIWIYDNPGAPYLNENFVSKAAVLFREAEGTAETDAVRTRVRRARLGIDYIRLTRAKRFRVEGGWYRPDDLDALKDRWKIFVAGLGQLGITNLSESSPLTQDDADFDRFMRPYRAVAIENEHLRVHVVPELGGRVIGIFHKPSARELLFQPDPSAKQYPNIGGLTVAPYPDYVAGAPWPVNWQIGPAQKPGETLLTGESENHLKLRRTLRLDGPFLRTSTVLENAGEEPVEVTLQSRWEIDPGPLGSVSYRSQSGTEVHQQLILPDRQPAGSVVFAERDQPDGEWTVTATNRDAAPVNRFRADQVARCSLNWTAKNENRVGMAVSSQRRKLQHGDTLALDADYGIR